MFREAMKPKIFTLEGTITKATYYNTKDIASKHPIESKKQVIEI